LGLSGLSRIWDFRPCQAFGCGKEEDWKRLAVDSVWRGFQSALDRDTADWSIALVGNSQLTDQ
jgi:hypothetical protein